MSDNPTSGQTPTHRSESSPAPQTAGSGLHCSPFIRAFTQPLTRGDVLRGRLRDLSPEARRGRGCSYCRPTLGSDGGSAVCRAGAGSMTDRRVPARGLRLRVVPPAGERADHYEGRLEFWDGVTETAWKVCEPTSIQHEAVAAIGADCRTVRDAARLAYRLLRLGGLGASGRRAASAGWQADQVLYLHTDRVRLQGPAIDVDADPLPDVVLEVDDVRRRKLGIYMESGFPEIWVLVPWEASVRSPGLAIHGAGGRGTGRKERAGPFRGGRRRRFTARSPRRHGRRRRGEPWNGPLWRWVRARARRRSTIRSWHRRARGCGQGATPKVTGKATWTLWPMSSHPGGSS